MTYSYGEWAILALALLFGLYSGMGGPPGYTIGSMLGASVLAVIVITGKRTWQAI